MKITIGSPYISIIHMQGLTDLKGYTLPMISLRNIRLKNSLTPIINCLSYIGLGVSCTIVYLHPNKSAKFSALLA